MDVTVTAGGGTSATNADDQFTFTLPPPTVTGVSPTTGPSGTVVTVTGTNFTGVSAVDFGVNAATTFTVNNSTTLTATAPSGTGTVDVTVIAGGGTSVINANDQFTYGSGVAPVPIPSPVSGGWQLNGSAQLVTTASPANLQLTAATNYVAGSAFWPTPVPGVGITAAFDAFIGPGSGADGMTFTLADASVTKPTALGVNGGGEGFSGITGIAVSLDTWQNSSDPSNNFVGIATTNSPMQSLNYVATNSSIPSLRNTVHHFVVTTTSTGITVTMDGTQVLTYATTLPPSVLVGFTGRDRRVQRRPPGPERIHHDRPATARARRDQRQPLLGAEHGRDPGHHHRDELHRRHRRRLRAGKPATAVTVVSATSITATSPAGTPGTVDVTVTTGGGTSVTNTNDQFIYTSPARAHCHRRQPLHWAEHGWDHGHDHRHELHRRHRRRLRAGQRGRDLHRQQRHVHHRHGPRRERARS